MVQVINTGNPQGKIAEMLGMSLGQGLGNGINAYFANKALEDVVNDKSLSNAPISAKMGKLQSALAPFGDVGKEMLQNRFAIEQQAQQEKETEKQEAQQKVKGKALGKYLRGEPLTSDEESLFTPKEMTDLFKAKNPKPPGGLTGQPIPKEQIQAIEKVIQENPEANPDQLAIEMGKKGINPVYSNPYIENRRRDLENQTKLIETGYKTNQDYLNSITDAAQAANEMDMRLDQMLSLEDLPTPALATAMESFGIPPSIFSADAETAEKLSIDLTKNIQQFYGNRILQSEFQAFLRSIPTLKNSPEGKKRIAENMKKFNDLKRLEYNTARAEELDFEAKKKPLPPSFRRSVYDRMQPEAEKLAKEFAEANRKPIPKNTVKSKPGKVRVKTPEGKFGYLTKENYEKAISNGEKYELAE